MKKMKQLFLITVVFLGGTAMAVADDKQNPEKDKRPGNTALPSNASELNKWKAKETGEYAYSVSDYFQRPKQSSFRFSPNGQYVSYREKDENGKRHIYVKNTENNQINRAITEAEDVIAEYGWANNDRLIYMKDTGGDENYKLYAVDLNGQNQKDLTPFDDVQVSILDELKDQADHMIISMNKDNAQIFEPYKINIKSGELVKLFENTDVENPIAGYDFDKDGQLRAYLQQSNGTDYLLKYRAAESEPFKTVVQTTWKDTFYILGFNYQTDYPHDAYVMSSMTNDTTEILLYDLKEGKTINSVFSNKTYDLGGMRFSRKRGYAIDFFYYDGEKAEIVPYSNEFKALHKKMKAEFADQEFTITSVTDEEDKYLIYVGSDRLYGIYYTYDASKNAFKEVFNLMPQLKPEDMAEMKPIKYKSRDGLDIYGYLTVPKDASKQNPVPLIVNPHGGPYGPRSLWGFDPEAQLFASRGYATLHVNFRGSGGYGKAFYLAGSKQIGRKMLDDLEDGVAYVKSLGLIDPKKMAIYGGSYGGLATLGSLVKTPDLYNCGIDYVGVSNLFTFYDSFPDYWKPYLKQVYAQWYDPTNPEEREIMKQVSPALNVDKITKPVFVIQGANDPRVNINESDQIVENLRSRGFDIPYMVKYNEGHGFSHEENRIELYSVMMGFLSQCLKP